MQVVIEISETLKKIADEGDIKTFSHFIWLAIVMDAIKNSTPLNEVLDKIRAEIESCREDEEPHLCDYRYHRNEGLDMALDIIDKYKAESEG
jgi:hypothetical protein